ncbi:MAG: Nif3-like dinuclear metal center hexameric protein [Candidatus Lightella neohaematopini]|nr:Nif3-like dinuclear metal center hexameric protein [Candidatus Lightella neohaematopini]
MINNIELEEIINNKLKSHSINDPYSINGLQVEGKKKISKIVTGVTICQKLIDYAIELNADAIIVHHGLLKPKNDLKVIGLMSNRLRSLLTNNINLYAWHIPLDIHLELGNNTQFAKSLNINIIGNLNNLIMYGNFNKIITSNELYLILSNKLHCDIIHYNYNNNLINELAWCTGSGHNYIELVARSGINCFVTGNISENTIYYSQEYKMNFYAANHDNTEVGGIYALSNWLKNKNLDVTFINLSTKNNKNLFNKF